MHSTETVLNCQIKKPHFTGGLFGYGLVANNAGVFWFEGEKPEFVIAHKRPHNAETVLFRECYGEFNAGFLALPVAHCTGHDTTGFADDSDDMSFIVELKHSGGHFFFLCVEHAQNVLDAFVLFLFSAGLKHDYYPLCF